MAIPPIISLLLLSNLFVFHSTAKDFTYQPSCPQSFPCGKLSPNLSFPFANIANPSCGLVIVNCTNQTVPTIYFHYGKAFDLIELSMDSVTIHDDWLDYLIHTRSCETFFNQTISSSPSISFSTSSQNLTLFKCFNSSDHEKFVFHGLRNYSCSRLTMYYSYPEKLQFGLEYKNIPKNCEAIQIPLSSKDKKNAGDVFSLLGSDHSVRLRVSDKCTKCREIHGQCMDNQQNLICVRDGVKGKKNQIVLLILGTATPGAAILLVCFLVIWYKCAKCYKLKWKSDQEVENFLAKHGALSPGRYTNSQVRKITNSFETKLGQGGYGSVFKGKLENGHEVAVKVLKESKGSGEEFFNEVATICRVSHVNVVGLLGYCFEGRKRALIYEFMPNGSLEKFICGNESDQKTLGWDVLHKIVIGIARGLEYLHRGCTTRILHFDIKPHNILLDKDFRPKISDFGLAKLCPSKESIISLSDTRGTIGYIAPEVCCRNFGGVSHKSDVYSYGMMTLEMVGGREPRDSEVQVGHTSDIYFPNWIYKRLEESEKDLGLQDIRNEEVNEELRKMIIVGLWCIQTDPTHRPSMSKVVEMLEGSVEVMEIPPKPYLFLPKIPAAHSSTTDSPIGKLFDVSIMPQVTSERYEPFALQLSNDEVII